MIINTETETKITGLTINNIYPVYATYLGENGIEVEIIDDYGSMNWHNVERFVKV